MKKHVIVGMLILNAFTFGANIINNSTIGYVCSLIGFGCFGVLYITENR
jgi:hypothetical protein